MLAEFRAGRCVALVQISADVAALDLGDVDAGAVVAGGQAHPVHFVSGALVVDERAGPELADRDEPWALDVVALPVLGAPLGGDERDSGSRGKE